MDDRPVGCLGILSTEKGRGVRALANFKKDDSLLMFDRTFTTYPTTKTLRIDETTHQQSANEEAFENFVNHSCSPNAYIDWDTIELRAVRDIRADEEITYNYFTSDWDGEDPFDCLCAASNCFGRVRGFKHLPLEDAMRIREFISPFLCAKLQERLDAVDLI